eukprot:TRINITY_DN5189_c0_g1_i1.p1 TRINITY_DN5189_c0_g1~~TRINITY_DN5189_c0_g1_i1.p1  ORF type:complete len:391 (+),score=64.29 TRINITY_DN5189_c0_g1_i1:74-1246(+)
MRTIAVFAAALCGVPATAGAQAACAEQTLPLAGSPELPLPRVACASRGEQTAGCLDGRSVRITCLRPDPLIVQVDDIVSGEEADAFAAEWAPLLADSPQTDADVWERSSAAKVPSGWPALERRLAALLRLPPGGAKVTLRRSDTGARHLPHFASVPLSILHDTKRPAVYASASVFFSDVEQGGDVIFPLADYTPLGQGDATDFAVIFGVIGMFRGQGPLAPVAVAFAGGLLAATCAGALAFTVLPLPVAAAAAALAAAVVAPFAHSLADKEFGEAADQRPVAADMWLRYCANDAALGGPRAHWARGRAVVWYTHNRTEAGRLGQLDYRTLYGECPVDWGPAYSVRYTAEVAESLWEPAEPGGSAPPVVTAAESSAARDRYERWALHSGSN